MADHGTLFSAPMVLALLAGTKTQTRRVLEPQPQWDAEVKKTVVDGLVWPIGGLGQQCGNPLKLPRFRVRDRLWVREAWQADSQLEAIPPRDMSRGEPIRYEADGAIRQTGCVMIEPGRARVGRHMPRWASRLTLIVTDVRVERLQEISRGDAMEGGCPFPNMAKGPNPRDWYAELWDALNGRGSWDTNPWVAAYTFTVHQQNIDAMESSNG